MFIPLAPPSAPLTDALPLISQALNAQPILSLTWMPYGIVMRSQTQMGLVEKLVSPDSLAQTLSGLAKPSWNTGLITPRTLWMGEVEGKRLVIEYRKPQMTGLWLEGSESAIRVQLPGLLMLREMKGNSASYRVYAVKRRPRSLKAKLYHAPLPNIGQGGACWGTVSVEKREPISLAPDWKAFLGSRFGDHSCHGKSKLETGDIRKRLIGLDGQDAAYPLDDLIDTKQRLENVIKDVLR